MHRFVRHVWSPVCRRLGAGLLGLSLAVFGVTSAQAQALRADFGEEKPSQAAIEVADWVVQSGDNQGMPFMVVDKVDARVFMFTKSGQLQGAAPALLGLATGDYSTPGIGQRKLSTIGPEERTTPAGRFVASLARNLQGVEILWVDYETSVSLHRVIPGKPSERRAQRLASESAADNRVSYGCINVPVSFYERVVSPAFTGTNGVVYVLPETRPALAFFSKELQAKRELAK
jgi:hypothetical protein